MKTHTILTIVLLCLLTTACKHTEDFLPEQRAQELVAKLNIEQKTKLLIFASEPIDELGIPAYNWWNEALHGVARNGKATVFPQPIGMAASFDEPLVNEVFTAVSDEARVKYRQAINTGHVQQYQGLTFWTPNINIFRDPRWGRGMETYGEDPYLTGQLGMAVVRGLQGPADGKMLKAHACAKHYAVHSGPESTRHSYNAQVSERDLRETYLPAFKDLVTKANVQEVMTAYNRFRDEPCSASNYLINTILRGEWGYKGIITSDCGAINNFFDGHGYSNDAAHAVAEAVKAGCDLECGDVYRHIPEAVKAGLLDEKDVDRNLVRLLAARIRLGELDRDLGPWESLSDDIVEGDEHVALARKMAQETIVLLQNNNNILPLNTRQHIAVIGPNADNREMMWGNYNGIPDGTVTLTDAMKSRLPGLVTFKGSSHLDAPDADVLKKLDGIDVVVFAGGISPELEGEEMGVNLPGFSGGDRTSIELPDVQRKLLQTLHEAGKKVVLVNFSGSAIGLVPETESCDAIVQAWYPGQEGGNAIADILFGDVTPSGKLPVTFYRNVSQLPDFDDYSMKNRTYRYFEGSPLYPFGYGLSYTSFAYGDAKVKGGKIVIPVTNTGSRDGVEIVQLYVRQPSDKEGPLKSLRGFKRVEIAAGQTVNVEMKLDDDTFLAWNEEKGDMVPAKGEWELSYGGRSDQLKTLTIKR